MTRQTRFRAAVALLAGVVLAGGAFADSAGEALYLIPPTGWKMQFHHRQGDVELSELVPAGQTIRDWTDMLSVQIFYGPPKQTAQELLAEAMARIKNECKEAAAGPVLPGIENGYETALRAVACPELKRWGKGEMDLYKSLRGRANAYLVERSWRGAPFEKAHPPLPAETTKEWLAFMNQVVLCDNADPHRPCPQANAGGTSPGSPAPAPQLPAAPKP